MSQSWNQIFIETKTKKKIYQDIWQLPNYFWFHPETKEFKGFRLVNQNYEDIQPNEQGWLWSDEMGLFVGIHTDGLLRLFSPDGALILSRAEEAEQQVQQERSLNTQIQQDLDQERSLNTQIQQDLDQERSLNTQIQQDLDQERSLNSQIQQDLDQERQRAARLAARLRQMGLDPDDF